MSATILQYLAFSTFIMFWVFAVLQVSYKKKLLLNYFFSGLFFAGGYQFFYYWAFSTGLIKYFPLLLNTEICFGFLIGPFLYSYFCIITGAKKVEFLSILPHLIPFTLALIIVTILNVNIPSIFSHYIESPTSLPDYSQTIYIMIINLLSEISLVIYFVLTLLNVSILLRARQFSFEIKIVLSFLLVISINEAIFIVANLLNHSVLIIFSLGISLILPTYYVFFAFRHPEFSIKVIKEAKTIRYKSSIMKNCDTDLIETRLLHLMKEEKLYTSEDLNLQSLSARLLITPHQLSSILNDSFSKNFNSFTNSFRIREAKRLLLQNPEKTILEIAFLVGFNSTSSFYTIFFRDTGVSPGAYRKKMLPDL